MCYVVFDNLYVISNEYFHLNTYQLIITTYNIVHSMYLCGEIKHSHIG